MNKRDLGAEPGSGPTTLIFFLRFLNLFLAYHSYPITPDNPYILDSTEAYGLRGVRLYYCTIVISLTGDHLS